MISSYPSYVIILVNPAGRIVLTAVKTMLCEYWIIKHSIRPVSKKPSSGCCEQFFSYKSDFLRLWLKNKRKGVDKYMFPFMEEIIIAEFRRALEFDLQHTLFPIFHTTRLLSQKPKPSKIRLFWLIPFVCHPMFFHRVL